MNIFPSRLFDHHRRGKVLATDASVLEHYDGRDPRFGIFRESARGSLAKGFFIRSDRTGNCTTWLIEDQITNEEGEVGGWRLTPTKGTVEIYPHLKDYVVYVWNT